MCREIEGGSACGRYGTAWLSPHSCRLIECSLLDVCQLNGMVQRLLFIAQASSAPYHKGLVLAVPPEWVKEYVCLCVLGLHFVLEPDCNALYYIVRLKESDGNLDLCLFFLCTSFIVVYFLCK